MRAAEMREPPTACSTMDQKELAWYRLKQAH